MQVGEDELEVVAWFCYLGDALSAGGCCELATRIRVKCGWKKFLELRNDRAMIRQVCGVKPKETQVRSQDLLDKLGLLDR